MAGREAQPGEEQPQDSPELTLGQRLHAQAQPLLTVTKDPAVQLTQCRGPGTDCTPAPRFTNPQCEQDLVGTAQLCFIQCHWGN